MTDIGQRIVDDAVAEMEAEGISQVDIGHALISEGLAYFRGRMCPEHILEQLAFVKEFIDSKTEELRKECG